VRVHIPDPSLEAHDLHDLALGHNRLAIVDLNPEAEQPFHDPEGDVHAVVNGELYGYNEIREQLITKGYKFRSKCDSEIAIYLYKEYGLSFLSHLRGEFSLCLYDSKSQLFVAACDRYAIKPLYYTVHEGNLLVSKRYTNNYRYCLLTIHNRLLPRSKRFSPSAGRQSGTCKASKMLAGYAIEERCFRACSRSIQVTILLSPHSVR
jgi:hypothetical protein